MGILDAYGRQVKNRRPILDELAGVGGVRDRYGTYPSHGLTPERLSAIFRQADMGEVSRQAELFEEMEEKDGHLGSVIATRKLAAAGLGWEVVAASSGNDDARIASFVTEALKEVDQLGAALLDILDAIAKGFSVCEIIWSASEGHVWASRLKWIHQRRFTFYARDRVLEAPRLLTGQEPVYGEELPPNKFVYFRHRGRSGIAPRGGLLRPCAWMYLFKNYTVKDWVIFNERYAQPLRVGKYSPGASEAEREVLRNTVFNLGTDAAAVISDSTVIELIEQAGKRATAEVYKELAAYCDRTITKAVLGHAGSADPTPGRLGGEHGADSVRQDILEADSRALADVLTEGLVRPLVGFNFGFEKPLPRLRFHHERAEDLEKEARTLKELASMGLRIPEDYLYRRFGIPVAATETNKDDKDGGLV